MENHKRVCPGCPDCSPARARPTENDVLVAVSSIMLNTLGRSDYTVGAAAAEVRPLLAAADAYYAELVEGLRKFVQHNDRCAYWDGVDCTCGLAAALRELEGK